MGKKLIVISADAMIFEDIEYLKALPNYQKYLYGGSWIKKVESIYPSVTYPCHVTMTTGAWPEKHGIVSNFNLSKGVQNPMPWMWLYGQVKTDDIFSAAKQKGLTTAAVFWPVTGNHPDIDYLIDEYWTQGPEDTITDAFRRTGSDRDMLKIIDRHRNKLAERVHPMCDEFLVACACDIIREKKPDLLMVHPANIDAYRHQTGLFHEKVDVGIEETDKWIGQIMEATEEAGIVDEVNLVLTSDHGQMDIKRIVNLNVLFADAGLMEVDKDGNVIRWDAYCLSNGLSALVYLNNSNDRELYGKMAKLLHELVLDGDYGISQVFTREEVKEKYHLDGGFSFVLESDDVSSIGSSCIRPLITLCNTEDYRYGKATHGHLPFKGPQPTFLAKGPDIRAGVVVEKANLIDEAPTFARLLGCSLEHADGKPVEEILKL